MNRKLLYFGFSLLCYVDSPEELALNEGIVLMSSIKVLVDLTDWNVEVEVICVLHGFDNQVDDQREGCVLVDCE